MSTTASRPRTLHSLRPRRRTLHTVLLGNPENRRVRFFQEALRGCGQPQARVVSWEAYLRGEVALLDVLKTGDLLRIDSPGESFPVERLLLQRGEREADEDGCAPRADRRTTASLCEERGRILYPRQWFLGLRAVLRQIDAEATEAGVRPTTPPADIALMFDKRLCHRHCARQGVPVPAALGGVHSFDGLLAAMEERRLPRVFVKLAYGSSASGVVALESNAGRLQAFSSVELVRGAGSVRLYNSLRVRRYGALADIAAILEPLIAEGVHVEAWIPKAGWQGQRCDLRVLLVGGEPRHTVLRLSRTPMTNLHLGNRRGDLQGFAAALGAERWRGLRETCRLAAAAVPRALHVGVDLLVPPGAGAARVAELNAFGDLLPGVVDQGEDTYAAQVRHLAEGGWDAPRPLP